MMDKEYKYYMDNQKKFLEKYSGKVIVIKDESVVGVYDDEPSAYQDAISKFELGTFLIQRCVSEKEGIQTFHSRVILH